MTPSLSRVRHLTNKLSARYGGMRLYKSQTWEAKAGFQVQAQTGLLSKKVLGEAPVLCLHAQNPTTLLRSLPLPSALPTSRLSLV